MPAPWHDSASGALLELPACLTRPRSHPLSSPLNVNLKLNPPHVTQMRRGHPVNIWLDKEAMCGKGTWGRGLHWICGAVMLERYCCWEFCNEIGSICGCSSGQRCYHSLPAREWPIHESSPPGCKGRNLERKDQESQRPSEETSFQA